MKLQDQVVLVTGASEGIGRATAELFAQQGAKVAINARSRAELEEVAEHLPNSFVIPADMSNEAEVREMIRAVHEHYGRLDILVNNAAQGLYGHVDKIETDQFRYLLEVNLIGPLIAMQEAIHFMRKHGGGRIINISSGVVHETYTMIGAYSATKAALTMLSAQPEKNWKTNQSKLPLFTLA
jgi:NAD(P)-dependent dehydrogenase (short-subunit alcohol dehydrogenase family)